MQEITRIGASFSIQLRNMMAGLHYCQLVD
jgi:hypothetical protein